jgi:hypothetical protein
MEGGLTVNSPYFFKDDRITPHCCLVLENRTPKQDNYNELFLVHVSPTVTFLFLSLKISWP